jgi:serine/threonine-protein kinase RsbW
MAHSIVLLSINGLEPFVETVAHAQQWDDKTKFHVQLALDELVVNAFTHGQKESRIRVQIDIQQFDQKIEIDIEDNGVEFDPISLAEPNINASLQDRDVGGLGIFFVKKMMDKVAYQRVGMSNKVHLTKTICN